MNILQSEIMVGFTHIQDDKAQMVDISGKGDVVREAVTTGRIFPAAGHSRRDTRGNDRERECVRYSPCCNNDLF